MNGSPCQILIGDSAQLHRVRNLLSLIAPTDANVLIQGESGTGKDLLARAVHRSSLRANAPFLAINCGALPDSLIESELFGHQRGAFTGADRDRKGLIREAEGGTLFLDEISELPLQAQAKLLRFLESLEIQPLGAAKPLRVNVRVIAATNADLNQRVADGQFRQDLYYRLNVMPVEVPALRERDGDIAELTDYFLDEFAAKHQVGRPRLKPCARRVLDNHSWPGNVRELRNVCERLSLLFSGREIAADNLPFELTQGTTPRSDRFQLPTDGISLADVEADFIRQALDMAHGNQSRAARLLGISRDTFLYRLKKMGTF